MPLHRRYLQERSHGGGAHPEPTRRAPDTKFTGNRVQITKDYRGYQLVDSKVSFSSLIDSQIKLCSWPAIELKKQYERPTMAGLKMT